MAFLRSGYWPAALREKQADRIQRLCGRLECSDACDKSMWHARPHIKPSINTVGHGARCIVVSHRAALRRRRRECGWEATRKNVPEAATLVDRSRRRSLDRNAPVRLLAS